MLSNALSIRVETESSATVVSLKGDLDGDGARQLSECVSALLFGRDAAEVVVDMSQVSFTDSAGLDALGACKDLCAACDIAFSVRNPSRMVRRILVLTGDVSNLAPLSVPSTARSVPEGDNTMNVVDDDRDVIADRRDSRADERDRVADARDLSADARTREMDAIMLKAAQREVCAERRDRLAEARDALAILRSGRLAADRHDADLAAIDRWSSAEDRDASADDRADLVRLRKPDEEAARGRAAADRQRVVDAEERDKAVLQRSRAAMENEGAIGQGR